MAALLVVLTLAAMPPGAAVAGEQSAAENTAAKPSEMTMDLFLDRLMRAESGGNDTARNPTSTALGPYQFIASTWLMLARQHFHDEMTELNAAQILALRTDRQLARRAAEAYTRDNAAYLVAQGQTPTFQNLRLAFLVGPGGAARILAAAPDARVSTLLGPAVIGANAFMANLTAGGLMARAARDIAANPKSTAGIAPDPGRVFSELFATSASSEFASVLAPPIARETVALLQAWPRAAPVKLALDQSSAPKPKAEPPKIEVDCDLSRTSCRRWLALAERKVKRPSRRASAPVAN